MKAFLFVATFFTAALALAYPTMGDIVVFKSTDGSSITLTNQGFDGQVWTILEDDGPSGQGNIYFSNEQIFHTENVANIIADCANQGGTAESLTVPAGTFASCKLPTDDGFRWVANVPFGIAKIQDANGTTELQSFTLGK